MMLLVLKGKGCGLFHACVADAPAEPPKTTAPRWKSGQDLNGGAENRRSRVVERIEPRERVGVVGTARAVVDAAQQPIRSRYRAAVARTEWVEVRVALLARLVHAAGLIAAAVEQQGIAGRHVLCEARGIRRVAGNTDIDGALQALIDRRDMRRRAVAGD